MYIILYNPLSSNKKGHKTVKEVIDRFEEERKVYRLRNLLSIDNPKTFISELKADDKIVLAGGDGTLSRSFSVLKNNHIKNDVYIYPAGTGNDFLRNYISSKDLKNKKMFLLKDSFSLPESNFDGEKFSFINGCGLGLDGEVSYQSSSTKFKNKLTYLYYALKNFITYSPRNVKITVDGKVYEFKDSWMVVIQNGKYFGGGMKIAPDADIHEEYLDLCVVHKVSRLKLFKIFPTIYSGKHVKYDKYVFTAKAKNVKVEMAKPTYGQVDGELPAGHKINLSVSVKDRVIIGDEQI